MVCLAFASTPSASPARLPTAVVGASSPSARRAAMALLSSAAFAPSSHVTGSFSNAVLACHQVSATTATALSPTGKTYLTPGMPNTAFASKPAALPPNTGHCAMAASSMFGSTTSIAYCAAPLVFSTVSSRGSGLPMIVQSAGAFSATSRGTGSLPAASASAP